MKAAVIRRYGAPEVLCLEEVDKPEPGRRDLLIEAHASSVNPVDTKIRKGSQRGAVRLAMPSILGLDVSGVVVATGDEVTRFKVGDEVYASPTHRRPGCYAEYVAVHEDAAALKPRNLTHEEAATLPLVTLTALRCLEPRLSKREGQRVHIQAGAGGVGSVAIQLARIYGAEVSTTCSASNAAWVSSLGAHQVIDYKAGPFDDAVRGCDLVLESVGGENWGRALHATRPCGQVASINAGLGAKGLRYGPYLGLLLTGLSLVAFTVRGWFRGVRVRNVVRLPDGKALERITAWVEQGLLRPVLDHVVSLDDIAAGHAALEAGGVRGKIAVRLRP